MSALGNPLPERALVIPIVWGKANPRAQSAEALEAEVSDETLLLRLRHRDKEALDILFDRHSRVIFGIGFRILGDRGEAEEIVQEVFLYLYERAALFDPAKGDAKPWIVQVGYHRALDRKGHLARRRFWSGTGLHSVGDTLTDMNDMEREILHKLDRDQLERAFQDLPDKQRVTLKLYFFEDMTLREISEKMGDPLPNVRHHYYRGLERLRKSAFVQQLRDKQR